MTTRSQIARHLSPSISATAFSLLLAGCLDSTPPSTSSVANEIRDAHAISPVNLLSVVGVASSKFLCTGVVISKTAVLTAAHCFCDSPTSCVSGGGITLRPNPIDPVIDTSYPNTPTVGPLTIIPHPNYVKQSGANYHDLLILRLDEPIPGYASAPAVLTATARPPGTSTMVVGRGDIGTNCESTSYGTFYYDDSFISHYQNQTDNLITDPSTRCHGDSGGPMFRDNGTLSPTEVVSIFSGWQIFLGDNEEVDTTVATHMSWIESNVPDLYDYLGLNEPWTPYQQFSGTKGTQVADVDGDKKADIIATNDSDIRVRTSLGSRFDSDSTWSNVGFFGNLGSYFADVDGDGKADAIVNNSTSGVTVRRSNGVTFGAYEYGWTQGISFQGTIGTFFSDVSGDGRADAIAVSSSGMQVRLSAGNGFVAASTWSGTGFYGQIGTFFADINADGRADAIAVNTYGTFVRKSTGTSFGPTETWLSSGFYGQVGTFFHDIDSDNRADSIAINTYGVFVRRAMANSTFGAQEQWSSVPYYGNVMTAIADVTGDRKADFIASNGNGVTVRRSRARPN